MANKLNPEEEVGLLWKVLKLHPELEAVAQVAELARSTVKYPLKSHDDVARILKSIKDTESEIVYRGNKLSPALALKFLPEEFFPIESEDVLLTRVLIAFMRGHLSHYPEYAASDTGRFQTAPDSTK
jgi:hypothetical protein